MPEDTKNSRPLTIPAGPGRPRTARAKHGIHSWVDSKRLPQGRAFSKTRRELGQLRTALIDRRGGDAKITPEELILIDSAIEALGVQKLLGLYVKTYGIIDGQSSKHGRLELSPILSKNWIAYANVTRQALLALNTLAPAGSDDDVLTPLQLAAVIDAEKAERAAQDAPTRPGKALSTAFPGRTDEGEGVGQGEGDVEAEE
jgi:hypothetical protein